LASGHVSVRAGGGGGERKWTCTANQQHSDIYNSDDGVRTRREFPVPLTCWSHEPIAAAPCHPRATPPARGYVLPCSLQADKATVWFSPRRPPGKTPPRTPLCAHVSAPARAVSHFAAEGTEPPSLRLLHGATLRCCCTVSTDVPIFPIRLVHPAQRKLVSAANCLDVRRRQSRGDCYHRPFGHQCGFGEVGHIRDRGTVPDP
jgi:hypothetical protein